MKTEKKRTTTTKKSSWLAEFQTSRDVKDALLIVSLIANLFVLCLWIALQLTSRYDDALVSFFIHR
ncbi:hypothetical protein KBD87_03860 [Candidatus Saccharibacteria bacterium]|nr:hypothetical protein [Candidatus Saccharibacteria bacterium]